MILKHFMNRISSEFKNFSSLKDTVKTVKRQVIDLEKIFLYHISDKGLLSQTVKILVKNTSNKNGQKV